MHYFRLRFLAGALVPGAGTILNLFIQTIYHSGLSNVYHTCFHCFQTLWTQNSGESSTKVSFCDLGCGNGLLVYLLNRLGVSRYLLSG